MRSENKAPGHFLNGRREKRLAYMRQFWLDNKERLSANQQRWREANRDKVRATNRAYYQTMREGRRLLLSLPSPPPDPKLHHND